MERNLGELSYNPKTLIPLYSGQGPNQFGQFMQSKIRQNILSACYNDELTVQQISLETGIPLPYLDDEIKALEDKQIIIREGKHFKANVVVITSECADEIERAVAKYYEQIADKMTIFLSDKLNEYKNLNFIGHDFSDNTLRWQLATILFRMISGVDCSDTIDAPKTGWGESAYLINLIKILIEFSRSKQKRVAEVMMCFQPNFMLQSKPTDFFLFGKFKIRDKYAIDFTIGDTMLFKQAVVSFVFHCSFSKFI